MDLLLGLGKSAFGAFLDQLLLLFQYPPTSFRALLDGTLPLRYCSTKFAREVPFWTLPEIGHVAGLVTAEVEVADGGEAEVASHEVHWVSGSGPGGKRIRPKKKKNLHTSWVVQFFNLGHVCGRGCVIWGIQLFLLLTVRGGVYDQHDEGYVPVQLRNGVG